jgi:hypothetical protein
MRKTEAAAGQNKTDRSLGTVPMKAANFKSTLILIQLVVIAGDDFEIETCKTCILAAESRAALKVYGRAGS